MTDASRANKARNRQIALNEEAKQVSGSARVSLWAIGIAAIAAAFIVAIVWIALRQ